MANIVLPVVNKQVVGNIVYVQYYVTQDTTQPRPAAFKLNIVVRVAGADYGSTQPQTIASGKAITLQPTAAGPAIDGKIDNWRGLLKDGSVDPDPNWKDSVQVAFLVSAIASVTIPIPVLSFVHPKVDIGHSDLYFPVA
jgi:hypothetical protein